MCEFLVVVFIVFNSQGPMLWVILFSFVVQMLLVILHNRAFSKCRVVCGTLDHIPGKMFATVKYTLVSQNKIRQLSIDPWLLKAMNTTTRKSHI
jgi:uncharacterized membrane protein YedE/YeeE